jgi:hypothetical protein
MSSNAGTVAMAHQDLIHLSTILRRHVDMLAELIGERNTAHSAGLSAARNYLRTELTKMGHSVVDRPFDVHDRPALNLEVILPGSRPRRATLVIGAHYDTVPGTPGADDNASAVAVLREIARTLARRKTKRTVRIVFFDCEEPPYFATGSMGSQFHAESLRRSGEKVLGMICLESLGYFTSDRSGHPLLPFPLRSFNRVFGQRYVVIVSDLKSVGFGLKFLLRFATSGFFPFVPAALPVTWAPDISLSDHRGYWEQGFPALMVTDTAHLRNPNYHQRTDRLHTLDIPRMATLCCQLQRAVRRMVT